MAANVSVIGKSARVRGRVIGAGDIEVRGFIEGEIDVDGDVLVEAQGMVGASIRGKRVVVRGAVKGDLVATEAVSLQEGARVVGEVRAPRVAIASGALVRGFVETGEGRASTSPRATRAQPATRPATPVARANPPQASVSASPSVAKAPAPQASVVAKAAPGHPAAGAGSPSHGGPRRPPLPVVPALKKAKGQVAKKKER